MLEGWTTISSLIGVTNKIKLGTLVSGIIYRHPSILAKIGATLDMLSNGRLFMGIGAGWNEEEALAYGIASTFPSVRERLDRLEEVIQIIRKMWTDEPTGTFVGKYYQIKNAYCNPKPIQRPSPPILVGGAGEKRTLEIVAKYADACNLFGSSETVKRKLDVLKEHCKKVGRDYDLILKTKLGGILIEKNHEEAKEKAKQILKGMPEQQIKEYLIYGTIETVQTQVEKLEEVGTLNLPQYVFHHVSTMAKLIAENRYDRLTWDVQKLTGKPSMSLREYVTARPEVFSTAAVTG
jgi:F420-dependent oxidoreductase-like protein